MHGSTAKYSPEHCRRGRGAVLSLTSQTMFATFPVVRTFFVRLPCSLTVFGRSLLLIVLEVVANAICLAIAARSHAILGLAILAWVRAHVN
ncbi:hypothetical protein J3R82DRAFT_9638 [Butyriboletus roseoflavus]|nr:hypothetical protein J3R82DRAFT_9638 [Butyriboletus roseoflavus]